MQRSSAWWSGNSRHLGRILKHCWQWLARKSLALEGLPFQQWPAIFVESALQRWLFLGEPWLRDIAPLSKFRWCNIERSKNDKCYAVAGWIDVFYYANFAFSSLRLTKYYIYNAHTQLSNIYHISSSDLLSCQKHCGRFWGNILSIRVKERERTPNGWWSLEKFIAYGREIAKRYSQRCYRLSRSGNQELLEES